MEITDVRVRIVDTSSGDRLKAVCTVTMDETFVVRDVKVVEGSHGPFVAMPSRKLSAPCQKCRTQNHLRAKFCNECGKHLPPAKIPCDDDGREKVHRDIAHPITSAFRQILQDSVLKAFEAELGPVEEEDRLEDEAEEETEVEVEEDVKEDEPEVEGSDDTEEEEEEEADDDDDARGNVSEYDAIIADLRGDRKRFTREREENQRSRQEKESKPSDRSRQRGRGRGRSDQDKEKRTERQPAARQPQRTQPPRREEPVVAKKPEPAPRPAPEVMARDDHDEEDSFAAGLAEPSSRENASSAAPAPRKEEPKPEPVESVDDAPDTRDDSDECDDTGFGAGIL